MATALGGTRRLYRGLSPGNSAAAGPCAPSLVQDPASPGPILTSAITQPCRGLRLLLLGLRLQLSLGLIPGNQAFWEPYFTGATPG